MRSSRRGVGPSRRSTRRGLRAGPTSIVNAPLRSPRGLLDDARAKGARIVDPALTRARRIAHTPPPTLVSTSMTTCGSHEDLRACWLIARIDLPDAIAFVNVRPRPLAVYYFGSSQRIGDRCSSDDLRRRDHQRHAPALRVTISVRWHRGRWLWRTRHRGFRAFSHQKAVFEVGRWNGGALRPHSADSATSSCSRSARPARPRYRRVRNAAVIHAPLERVWTC
jgi:coniferyl-aldehyde dehydrogenase